MKKTTQWARAHPLKVFIIGLLAASVAAMFAGGRVSYTFLWFAFAAILLTVLLVVRFDLKKLPAVLLAFSLATPMRAEEKPQSAAGVGVAIVVVCAGAVCVYTLVRFCQKHFPKKPTKTNELYSVSGGAGDEYGGSWNHGSLGSCFQSDSPPVGFNRLALNMKTSVPSPALFANAGGHTQEYGGGEPDTTTGATLFSLNVFVASPTELRRTMTADTRPESFQSWVAFQSEVASHGLWVSGRADGSQYFSRNGVPVSAGEIPLRFDAVTGQVIHDRGGQLVHITIEASTDLENWQRLASVVHGVGEGFQIADVSIESQQFYRVLIAP